MRITYLAVLFLVAQAVRGDWWSDLVDSAHSKIVEGANYMRDKAAPAVRDKFNEIKETLQDPETHRKAKEWIQDTALPAVRKPFDAAGEFIQDEVAPEVKKIVEAYKKSDEVPEQKKQSDVDEH